MSDAVLDNAILSRRRALLDRAPIKVGEGSYGAVYRAWDSELERDVAIKIFDSRAANASA